MICHINGLEVVLSQVVLVLLLNSLVLLVLLLSSLVLLVLLLSSKVLLVLLLSLGLVVGVFILLLRLDRLLDSWLCNCWRLRWSAFHFANHVKAVAALALSLLMLLVLHVLLLYLLNFLLSFAVNDSLWIHVLDLPTVLQELLASLVAYVCWR